MVGAEGATGREVGGEGWETGKSSLVGSWVPVGWDLICPF